MPRLHLRARALPLALLSLCGCRSENPIGFWDILSLELTWEGETQIQEDLGTLEVGERDGGGGVVLRYELLDPSTLATGADTAGGSDDWMVPMSPPFVGGGPPSDWDDEGVTLNLGPLRMSNIDVEDYRGTSMRVTCETAQIESAIDMDAVLELER
jgi:hypothetical protein